MNKKLNIGIIVPFWPPAQVTGTEISNKITADILVSHCNLTVITTDSYRVRYVRNLLNNPRIHSTVDVDSKYKIIRLKHDPIAAFLKYVLFKIIGIFSQKISQLFYGPQIDINSLSKAIEKSNFDIVYISSLPYALNHHVCGIIMQNKLKIKIILQPNYHQATYYLKNRYYRNVLSQAHSIHVWTKAEKRQVCNDYNIEKKKIQVIRPPIVNLNYKISSLIMNLKIEKLSPFVLYAGAKNKDKGVYDLINAFLLKKNAGELKTLKLITIGPHDFSWSLYTKTHKLPFLIDMGFVSDEIKEQLFKKCSMFCMPSNSDSFGFAYLDAWRYKKPVIAAQTEVAKELIFDNKAGLLIDRNNVNKFANAIALLLNNKRLASRLGENGYNLIQNKFSYKKNLGPYLKLFKI